MYKILHIPSGSYLCGRTGKILRYEMIEQAKMEIRERCGDAFFTWNRCNEHIGYNLIENEFEPIEIE